MENFDQPLGETTDTGQDKINLVITPVVREYWSQISKWALFFAILLFVAFGLVSLIGLIAAFGGSGVGFIGGIFIVAFYGAFLFFPGLFYYRFSTQMKEALHTDNGQLLDEAFINLKQFYRYVGILIIVLISLVLLFFIFFGAAMMSGGLPTR